MLAYQFFDHNEAPQLHDIARPEPGPGQVQLKIAACGVNFADLLMASGDYQDMPLLPFTLGMEVAGTVAGVGTGVAKFKRNDRVAVYCGHGGLAEYGCFDANRCVPIPDAMPFDDAATLQIAHGTSHMALRRRANLQSGETLLVLGAAGGVGLSAIRIGKILGARVIAVARGENRLDVARNAGADHLVSSETDDIRQVVKSLGGADVVYDPVGGAGFTAALRACNPEARILTIGFASGDIPQIPANILLVKNLTVMGFYWGGYLKFNAKAFRNSQMELMDWYGAEKLRPDISHILPLAQADKAMALLRLRTATGKIVIRPQPASAAEYRHAG